MDNQITDVNKALFSAWVSDPSEIRMADAGALESMALKYPYCQILQFLVSKSAGTNNSAVLARTSLYAPDRKVLFKLINHPEAFKPVTSKMPENESFYEVIEDDDYSAELVSQESQDQSDPVKGASVEFEEAAAPIESQVYPDETETAILQKETVDMNAREEEEKTILENIAATDFFTFDEKLDVIQSDQKENAGTELPLPAEEQASSAPSVQEVTISEKQAEDADEQSEINELARYDDDSMPYSFLWWLHKTRKEHAGTYQPYVDFKLDPHRSIKKTAGPELNQQMIENIFHLQSPLDELERKAMPQTVPFDLKRKEEEIIEKFIRDEPQIHPPSPDKLDLENKARKSAEDPNDLVSETLAAIYTEQMLFHKAIDTYQKLSLKFPEKKGYFADQISELQKKIN